MAQESQNSPPGSTLGSSRAEHTHTSPPPPSPYKGRRKAGVMGTSPRGPSCACVPQESVSCLLKAEQLVFFPPIAGFFAECFVLDQLKIAPVNLNYSLARFCRETVVAVACTGGE